MPNQRKSMFLTDFLRLEFDPNLGLTRRDFEVPQTNERLEQCLRLREAGIHLAYDGNKSQGINIVSGIVVLSTVRVYQNDNWLRDLLKAVEDIDRELSHALAAVIVPEDPAVLMELIAIVARKPNGMEKEANVIKILRRLQTDTQRETMGWLMRNYPS